jgi:CubicO group peptidase (beta-lactamase class C family)
LSTFEGLAQRTPLDDPSRRRRPSFQRIRDLEVAELNYAVGSRFAYSNVNYATLGLLVQTVSGQSYGDYIQQHVFDRLDMRHSFISQARAREQGLATVIASGSDFPWRQTFHTAKTESPAVLSLAVQKT